MSKKNRPTDGGGNWMDTYGDMVTLLLTFFVMLYSMSNLNEQKWEVFVRSIYPDGAMDQEVDSVQVNGEINPDAEEAGMTSEDFATDQEFELDLDTLYLTIAEIMNAHNVEGVTASRGDGYTFVTFDDNVFFNGDESAITRSGKEVLALFCDAITPVKDAIAKINVMAHTAQGDPNRLNTPRTDRMLSAMRGSEVCIFIQEREAIEPEKLINISYGQFYPIASNDTAEGRAKNRRVEILLVDAGVQERSLSEYLEEYRSGLNADTTVVTDGHEEERTPKFAETEPNQENQVTMMQTSSNALMDGPGMDTQN